MPSTRSVTCSQSVTYGGNGGLITVWYHPSLDGGGSIMAPHFVRLLTDAKRPLGRVLELCAGPGFIAFALLASGRATSVVISDANPAAIECARKTVRTNRIGARARALVANVTRGLPRAARFETVVVNPPNFYAMRGWVSQIVGSATGDLRGEDRGWALHRELYAQLPPFMAPHARLYVQEVQPWSTHVHACAFRPDGRWIGSGTEPCDVRPEPPISVFKRMISAAGLRLRAMLPFDRFGAPLRAGSATASGGDVRSDRATMCWLLVVGRGGDESAAPGIVAADSIVEASGALMPPAGARERLRYP